MKYSTKKIKESGFVALCGIDDATKCPCIGSIFVSGVVANSKTIRLWKKLGVKDSKLITKNKREKLEQIIKETALSFTIAEISPAMIDDKQPYNLNDWEMLVTMTIMQKLQKSSAIQTVIIDNWEVTEDLFRKRFNFLCVQAEKKPEFPHNITIQMKEIINIPLIPQHFADENYTVVGAASILSKQASDKQYAEYKRLFGDFGSGSPADPKTRLFVWQHRHAPPPIIRTSWHTFKTLALLEDIESDPIYARHAHKLNKAKYQALP